MPEEVEVETKDLQEAIAEIHERHAHGKEGEAEGEGEEGEGGGGKGASGKQAAAAWIRYIALTTALFAVFAAVGAMQSGAFVNEAMMLQIKASDTWSEYQANRQKEYLFTTQADALLDRGVTPAPLVSPASSAPDARKSSDAPSESPGGAASAVPDTMTWKALTPPARLAQYIGAANKEHGKTVALREEAEKYEKESKTLIERHHRFAWSVALIQVAIALAAIAALTRVRLVWVLSMAVGLIGLYFFALGAIAR